MIIFKFTLFSFLLLLSIGTNAASAAKADEHREQAFDDIRIVGSFSGKTEAEELLRRLLERGYNARILIHNETVNVKTINIGLYPNRQAAQTVIEHLKSNNIEAFSYRRKSGDYRIHTGAMQGEERYWERFERLRTLGYKRIHTAVKPTVIKKFLVAQDIIENTDTSVSVDSPAPIIEVRRLNHTFLSARFKGEFYVWDDSGKQGSNNYFSASLNAKLDYDTFWDFNYGFRFEAQEQSGNNDILRYEVQPLPIYLGVKQVNSKWRIGLIDARWDEREQASLSDRLSSKILTRYLLDAEVIDRRRPIIGGRWQLSQSQYKLDVIANPIFMPAKMPGINNIWHPVNRSNGEMLGIRATADWQALVKKGSFADETYQIGGIGIRMSQQIGQRTRATTIQYVRRSAPYYELNPDIQKLISAGTSVDAALATADSSTFTPKHPYSAIFTWEEFGEISHIEVAVSSNTPYTTETYQMKTAASVEWMLGFVYPSKEKNTHFSSFVIGRWINTRDETLDRKTKLGLKGEFYRYFLGRHWQVGTAYQVDFDYFGLYLSPKISYEQSKHLKLSLYSQLFSGSKVTDSGYYRDRSLIALNWQAVF